MLLFAYDVQYQSLITAKLRDETCLTFDINIFDSTSNLTIIGAIAYDPYNDNMFILGDWICIQEGMIVVYTKDMSKLTMLSSVSGPAKYRTLCDYLTYLQPSASIHYFQE